MYNLERFLDAQRFDYASALAEIKAGQKTTHWIWYIFPQMKGLGHSPNSQYYGITSLDEAKEYLSHPVLGTRLRKITEALLAIEGKSAEEILSRIDAQKVKSSMTLFNAASPGDIFEKVLEKYYAGKVDGKTLGVMKCRQ